MFPESEPEEEQHDPDGCQYGLIILGVYLSVCVYLIAKFIEWIL